MVKEAVMTDPVDRISGAKELDRNTARGETFKGGKSRRHADAAEDDSVDISDEARERSSGGKERDKP
jgi:hypothetical protein